MNEDATRRPHGRSGTVLRSVGAMNHGYRIDHIEPLDRCCTSHNIRCEPPGDLCCHLCPEATHYRALEHKACVLDPCPCRTEAEHLGATQAGMSTEIGMREPTDQETRVMNAVSRVLAALAQLDAPTQQRVLAWAADQFGVDLVQSTREDTRG